MLPAASSLPHAPDAYLNVNFPTFQLYTATISRSLQDDNDPNSPVLFKQNMHLIQQHVAQIQALARTTLASIQNAYHAGNSSAQAEANLSTLKETLHSLREMLLQSGVGGLPMLYGALDGSGPIIPTEDQLIEETGRNIEVLYQRLKRNQESAAVVADIISSS
ncbi:hypothetical protein FISHEDRAFT_73680 [Fistulina hepatica ATCC 64428]|uniref:Mediator of RNA polymerase II transcription subunit 11 n=1 Tax=Fistulina hepatica ATCC 64428 TaxID=1128425 RepID=A0A0D7ACA9_9AGAR|nr:hypothetical protein FISHEDRAFT_73680 [Fistulina hepatica ATCC 64428]